MNFHTQNRIQSFLDAKRQSGLYRQRSMDAGIDKSPLSFSSNDYLSLTTDPRLQKAYQYGYAHYAVGSGGSPLVTGYHPLHRDLERAFSEALEVDDCLFFSSGYAANLSLMKLLVDLNLAIYCDKAAHASVYDGLALAAASFTRYRHCDVENLASKIDSEKPSVVITESIFSMSGRNAPLEALAELATLHDSDLVLDEAHAFGVIGPEGLGLVPLLNLTQDNVPLRIIPLGKAFAGQGAMIAGKGEWIEALLQSARSYRYSTAPSPAMAYGLLHTLEVVRAVDDRRQKLAELIMHFRARIQALDDAFALSTKWAWSDSLSTIQQLQIGCPFQAQLLERKLLEQSIRCISMRPPTVAKKETGLRVILNYQHQIEDIDTLFGCLYP